MSTPKRGAITSVEKRERPNVPRLDITSQEVQQDHRARLDTKLTPALVPRPFKHRPRPKTAIISAAAARLREIRENLSFATEQDEDL